MEKERFTGWIWLEKDLTFPSYYKHTHTETVKSGQWVYVETRRVSTNGKDVYTLQWNETNPIKEPIYTTKKELGNTKYVLTDIMREAWDTKIITKYV